MPPPGACDAHCHIFGPGDRYPYHPDRTYTPPDAGLDRFRAVQAHLGLDRAVLVNASCHGVYNEAMLDAIAASDGRYRGVAIVDDGFTADRFAALDAGGIRGVRFNFVRHLGGPPDLDVLDRILRRIAPLGWHVVLHFDAGDLVDFAGLLDGLPIPYLIDHMGRVKTAEGLEQEPFRRLVDRLERDPNCWVKISGAERISAGGPPFADAVPFARRLVEAAADRVLWGTDWPHPNIARTMPDDGDLVDLLPDFMPDPAVRQAVLVDNPARLYGFPAPSPTPPAGATA